MRIIYLIKKGLQYYPPCLAQVLMLNDLGAELVVYHGKNSPTINAILDKRMIKHFEFVSDRDSKNRVESAFNFLKFAVELRKMALFDNDDILWFGNAETIIAADFKRLKERKFVSSILELYKAGTIYDIRLRKILKYSVANLCCEKHRAAIMQCIYKLDKMPYTLSNKPYTFQDKVPIRSEYRGIIEKYKGCFIILYQGIISNDRPLDKIAEALNVLNDKKIVFFILGKCNEKYKLYLKSIYERIEFFGFIPAPEHLAITSKCHLGIANYGMENLNNVFCAPNKIYEYAKYGLPILCSQNIGLTETVGVYKAGECIDLNNVQKIIESINIIRLNYTNYSKAALALYNETNNVIIIKEIYDTLARQ